jgi:hypothetical protein
MPSGRLGRTIERELRARPVFIVMLSPAALASSWVEDETRWAYSLQCKDPTRIILPVLCSEVSEDEIWLFLQEFKRIEEPGGRPFPKDERVQRTLRALTLTPAGKPAVAVLPQPGTPLDDLLVQGRAMLAQGVPVPEVARILGHASPDIIYRLYAHAIPQAQRQALDAMERILHG